MASTWASRSGTRPEDLTTVGWRNSPMSRKSNGDAKRCQLDVEHLENRVVPALSASQFALNPPVIDAAEVPALLQRAAAATASNDGINAIVDRGGNILGVLQENGFSPLITGNPDKLKFAV